MAVIAFSHSEKLHSIRGARSRLSSGPGHACRGRDGGYPVVRYGSWLFVPGRAVPDVPALRDPAQLLHVELAGYRQLAHGDGQAGSWRPGLRLDAREPRAW